MSTTSPSSTAGSSTSCWDLENRCTSSMKSIVPWPCSPRRRSASAMASRTSFTPAAVAESVVRCLAVVSARRRARVVLPVPAGPQRMEETTRSDSARTRSGAPGATRCSWPTISSSVRGRRRVAKRGLALEAAVRGVAEEGHGARQVGRSSRSWSAPPSSMAARTAEAAADHDPDAQLGELGGRERRRGAREQVGAGLGLGVRDDLADVLLAGQDRGQPVHPEREAGVRRRPVAEGAQQEPEAGLGLLGSDPERREHLRLRSPGDGYAHCPTRAPTR